VELRAPLSETGGDRIRLVLPAEPDYGRIARVAASSLALRLGLTFVEIEDLRIAVDEAVILLLRPEGTPGDITLEFTVEPHALAIDASVTAIGPAPAITPAALRRFEEIVADTVDEFAVDLPASHVHLVKRY
jgi:anti-sigma regulatory factor (Ser/Thr protein kinase)